jgi:hypothetical protein
MKMTQEKESVLTSTLAIIGPPTLLPPVSPAVELISICPCSFFQLSFERRKRKRFDLNNRPGLVATKKGPALMLERFLKAMES